MFRKILNPKKPAMKAQFIITTILISIFSVLQFNDVLSQDENDSLQDREEERIKVFIDAGGDLLEYLKTEVRYIDYVRDIHEAELFILITSRPTGSGGNEYTLLFSGEKRFEAINDTLTFFSKAFNTEAEIREGLLKKLEIGLLRYIEKTPLSEYIVIKFKEIKQRVPASDNWDNWIFSIGLSSYFSGEKLINSTSLSGFINADRITDELKTSLSLSLSYYESNFKLTNYEFKSISRSQGLYTLIVKSIGPHFSAGGFGRLFSSTYNNFKLSLNISPALEYDLFSYSQSVNKQFIVLYKIGYDYYDYYAETIYKKNSEGLFSQSLTTAINLKQKWGSLGASLTGFHYLEDIKKNRLQLSGNADLRVFEGLSLNISSSLAMIHDQISLPRQGTAEEEILLRQRQIETQYYYSGSIGLRYSFGSIFNNIVNPRFSYVGF